jgi:uncharacterized Rmd1/YagE family protein
MRCTSYCTAETYYIDRFAKFLRTEGFEPKFYRDVIHITRSDAEKTKDIFFFPYGCVIMWGLEEEEEGSFLESVNRYAEKPKPLPIVDTSTYLVGERTYINEEEDEIVIETEEVLVKLSISHGLAQSVKLTSFEETIAKTIENTRHLPRELAEKGKIALPKRKLSQKLGELFAERNSVNLHTDILDIPEFFWRRPKYEPYYHLAAEYMDISTRLDILNRRLDVIHELYEILSNELNHLHSARLEIIVILLIMIEVVLVIIKDFLKFV